jgi:hypothetical protein
VLRRQKFRSFLLAGPKNFLANEWDKSQAQKRGGGKKVLAHRIPTENACEPFGHFR